MPKRDQAEDTDLQAEEHWDWKSGRAITPSTKHHRAIVSVAFAAEDFALVAQAAREAHMPVSTFIKQAAVERAGQAHLTAKGWTSGNRSWAALNVPQVSSTGARAGLRAIGESDEPATS